MCRLNLIMLPLGWEHILSQYLDTCFFWLNKVSVTLFDARLLVNYLMASSVNHSALR